MKNLIFVFAIILASLGGRNLINSNLKPEMNKKTVQEFAEAINQHNVEKMSELMTDDHKFIDSQGNELVGKVQLKKGWKDYFQFFPDYKIEIAETFERSETVAMFGFAGEKRWRLPVAWKAIVQDGKIKVWQVFADTKIPFEIIEKKSGFANVVENEKIVVEPT